MSLLMSRFVTTEPEDIAPRVPVRPSPIAIGPIMGHHVTSISTEANDGDHFLIESSPNSISTIKEEENESDSLFHFVDDDETHESDNLSTGGISPYSRVQEGRESTPYPTFTSATAAIMKRERKHTKKDKHLLAAIPLILSKFDALFPFYRLTDKDCKDLSQLVLNELDKIAKIFCISQGRSLDAMIYYQDETSPKILKYYNDIDSEDEVSQWKDVVMEEDYCLSELDKSFY